MQSALILLGVSIIKFGLMLLIPADPVRMIAGSSATQETVESIRRQLGPESILAEVPALDFERLNPVTGPVHVEGAEPGDTLVVLVEWFVPSGWGWTAVIPGFGLLADEFPDPALRIWPHASEGLDPAAFGGARVPLKPFCGTIGVAPAEPGLHSLVPPGPCGGNMDIRDLAAPGRLFSVGDTHAAQGDREVCGTAVESPLRVALEFDLRKGGHLPFPQFETDGPVTRHLDSRGYFVTTGIGPDLMENARAAVRRMVEEVSRAQGVSSEDAYKLCSVCGDLRISEIVDQRNWVSPFYFPKVVFD